VVRDSRIRAVRRKWRTSKKSRPLSASRSFPVNFSVATSGLAGYSADGARIVFASNAAGGGYDAWVVGANGGVAAAHDRGVFVSWDSFNARRVPVRAQVRWARR
jgi:hypothetical protein